MIVQLRLLFVSLSLSVMSLTTAAGSDWPMWRYDAGRTAASPHELPDRLELRWNHQGTPRTQAWDDPLNLDLMTYDRVFEPIVLQGRMFVGHSDRDKLTAIDVQTGKELWSFYTEAPVRLPPAGWQNRIYLTSDDGRLYCVDAEHGHLLWKFDAAAGPRRVVGNQRLISAWPARGGAVVRDGKVYFAASIWPFMGVFIYALDAESGTVEWVNDSSGSTYIKQPHSAPSFAGVGPQGALVATTNDLIVPGGRSVPAVFDRHTGKLRYFELNAGGKGSGGSFVVADDSVFFVHTRQKGVREFNLQTGLKTAFQPNEPVLHNGRVYSSEMNSDNQPVVRSYDADRRMQWEVAADGHGDLILAGQTLYAAGPSGISAIRLPNSADSQPQVVWKQPSDPHIQRLLAASEMLFGVTQQGHILAWGKAEDAAAPSPHIVREDPAPLELSASEQQVATQLLAAGDAQGYALWYGAADTNLIQSVAAASPFVQLAIVDADANLVNGLRQSLDAAGLYGAVTAHQATPVSFDASPYVAHMIFVGREQSTSLAQNSSALKSVYNSVRPYGGTLQLLADAADRESIAASVKAAQLENAELEISDLGVVVRRIGALPGSADWTHLHGDIGNTRKSNDSRVKLPLGVLWFGGSSNMDVLPRHGHGPPQQVVDGRLFIQGMDSLSARDVYTGRVLWKRTFENLGTFDVYYDATYKDTPLNPAYNQVHIPGANARGTNFVVTSERVYIVEGAVCRALDPATGTLLQTIELPQENPDQPAEWSYIGVYEDVLIGGLGFAKYRSRLGLSFEEEDSKFTGNKAGFGSKSFDRAGSLALVGFDRLTGKQLWKVDATHSFWNNAIVAGDGRIYCMDRNPRPVEDKLRRRGIAAPDTYRILALNARSGQTEWQVSDGIFGTWLGYSEQHGLLLQAGAAASDRLAGEPDQGMTVYRGTDGSQVWSKPDLKYSGPCILHNDLIITNANSYRESAGAFYLKTGEPQLITNPVTGEQAPWKITRAYGCNTILASENLLTFRSGAAGFYDLKTHSGTGNFGGFKSGCTGNLIAAGGVLNAPDYTRTCSCSYQNQTSLALVHMPEIELWTVDSAIHVPGPARPIENLGINFGAPGHQRDPDGTLWVEWPPVASETSPVTISSTTEPQPFARHSSALTDTPTPWIFASGLQGAVRLKIGTTIGNQESVADADTDAEIPEFNYRIRLYFGAPPSGGETETRSFDVHLNNVAVLKDVRLDDGEMLVRELPDTVPGQPFELELIPRTGVPVLSGLEMQRVAP